MNWYSVFYWLSVGDKIQGAAATVSIISGVLFLVMMIATICGGFYTSWNEEAKRKEQAKTYPIVRNIRNWALFTFFLLGAIAVFTPTKRDMILIVAGGAVGNFITSDSSAKALPADVTKYLHNAIQEEMSDLSDHGENLADKAKSMTKEELLEQINKGNIILKKD